MWSTGNCAIFLVGKRKNGAGRRALGEGAAPVLLCDLGFHLSWHCLSGWWFQHPSEKYESQLG